jgi:heat shock protein HslJ
MRLLGLLAVGISLTACGSEAPPAASIGGGAGGSPVGKAYLSVQVTEDGKPKQLAPNTRLRLDFRDAGNLGFHAGCNQMGGEVSLDGGTVTMDQYGGTEMACPDRQAQEVWLAKLLTGRPTWKLEGDTLTLTKGSTTVVLKDRKIVEPDLPIAGTKWTVDGVLSGEAVEHFPGMASAHFTIEGERATGSTGCNAFGGPVTRTATTLSFGALSMTLVGCVGDRARLEGAVIAALAGPLTYSIDYNRLELRTADGKGGLNLIAEK